MRNSSLYYIPENPCPHGHVSPRLISTRRCLDCKSSNMRKWRVKEPWVFLLDAAKARAKLKKLPFDLDVTWAEEAYSGRCQITKIPFVIGRGRSGFNALSPTIDRINPRLGYLKNNCRFVLMSVNVFKGQMTDEEMKSIALAIVD